MSEPEDNLVVGVVREGSLAAPTFMLMLRHIEPGAWEQPAPRWGVLGSPWGLSTLSEGL